MYHKIANEIDTADDALQAMDAVGSIFALLNDLLVARRDDDLDMSDRGADGLRRVASLCSSLSDAARTVLTVELESLRKAKASQRPDSYERGYVDGYAVGAMAPGIPEGAEKGTTAEFTNGIRIGFLAGAWQKDGPGVDFSALRPLTEDIVRAVTTPDSHAPCMDDRAEPRLTEPVPEAERGEQPDRRAQRA